MNRVLLKFIALPAVLAGALALAGVARADNGEGWFDFNDASYSDDNYWGGGYYDTGYYDDSYYDYGYDSTEYGDEIGEDEYGIFDTGYDWESDDDGWF